MVSTAPAIAHCARYRFATSIIIAIVGATLGAVVGRAQPSRLIPPEHELLMMKAIEHIDNGKIDSARVLLQEGIRRFPSDPSFPYELAYIHYQLKEYREARTILETLVEAPRSQPVFFQLLGNTLDLLGDPDKAIAVYKRGLERFPRSGPLYLELGVMAGAREEYATAVEYWEKGVEKAPDFPSNYFHAARMFMATTERGWGMLYGELFLNIEPGSPRSANTRNELYHAWNDAITTSGEGGGLKDGETSVAVALFDKLEVFADSSKAMIVPFKFFLFRSFLVAAMPVVLSSDERLTIATLHGVRRRFIENWYADTATAAHFDIELFGRWRELDNAGLLEAYDHMIFYTKETEAEVNAWSETNGSKLRDVTSWLRAHPIGGGRPRPFSRLTVGSVTMTQEELDARSALKSTLDGDVVK
jgi:tetratricopeptide (TPR) repeat protein